MSYSNNIRIAADEVAANFRKSILLLFLLCLLFFGLACLLGYLVNDMDFGIKTGFLVCLIVVPLELMSAKFCITSNTNCSELDLNDPKQKELLNIVQGISIAAGLSRVPDVYIIENPIPNAFAAGWNEDSAYIGVTTGLLELLDRQELEGVIGHEVSHIMNRDIQLTQTALALNTAIVILATIIKFISIITAFFSRGDFQKLIVSLLMFIFIKPLAVLVSFIIVMCISRTREYAADAQAVRLCSYKDGLITALKKLSQQKKYTADDIESLGGQSYEYLYFTFFDDCLFSTHPDIKKRIERLEETY